MCPKVWIVYKRKEGAGAREREKERYTDEYICTIVQREVGYNNAICEEKSPPKFAQYKRERERER